MLTSSLAVLCTAGHGGNPPPHAAGLQYTRTRVYRSHMHTDLEAGACRVASRSRCVGTSAYFERSVKDPEMSCASASLCVMGAAPCVTYTCDFMDLHTAVCDPPLQSEMCLNLFMMRQHVAALAGLAADTGVSMHAYSARQDYACMTRCLHRDASGDASGDRQGRIVVVKIGWQVTAPDIRARAAQSGVATLSTQDATGRRECKCDIELWLPLQCADLRCPDQLKCCNYLSGERA